MEDREIVFEQYKLYVELMDRVSERRHKTNNYFLSLNVFLISFLGAISVSGFENLNFAWTFCASVAGMILCYSWYRLVKSYRDLNTGKFVLIHKIEECLPLQPFKDEWSEVGKGKDSKKYLPFTHIEVIVPTVFGVLYAILMIWCLFKIF
ncbi:MAG: RipA family octameric membrane protein [Opitutales bacterium]